MSQPFKNQSEQQQALNQVFKNDNSNDLIDEDEEYEEEEFSEQSQDLRNDYDYNDSDNSFNFLYKGYPVTVRFQQLSTMIQIFQAKIDYEENKQFLSFIAKTLVQKIENIKKENNIIIAKDKKKDETIQSLFEEMNNIKKQVEDIDTTQQKYPNYDKFFNVPLEEQIRIKNKKKQAAKQKFKQQVRNFEQKLENVLTRKNRFKRNYKTKNKK